MKAVNHIKTNQRNNLFFCGNLIILTIGGFLLSFYLKQKGYYASGCDAWGHIFKGNLMYEGLIKGELYPLYTSLWYNGLQPYRYWAPLPYYFWAILEVCAKGNIQNTYYLFAGVIFIMGGLPFLLWGRDKKANLLGLFLGILWFFMPENVRVFFCEGNFPRIMTTCLIPYLVYYIWKYVSQNKDKSMIGIVFCMALMTLSHVMIAAMMGIATFVFLILYAIGHHRIKRSIEVIAGMLIGIMLCGIWLIPALSGGLVGMDKEASSSVMASLSYDLNVSLNPMNRISGVVDTFYYGISIVIISFMGIFLSRNKEKMGYIVALVILLATTTAFIPILSKLPLSQLLWMMRFSTIAYAFFIWSILEWDKIKPFFMGVLLVILMIDCLPSFNINRYYTSMQGKADRAFNVGKQITSQRIALFDLSTYGSYPAYAFCSEEDKVQYSYGWAWQGATTAPNIVLLNTAIETEEYLYLFDRALELGNDTVLYPKALVGRNGKEEKDLLDGAAASGYLLYDVVDEIYIFHRDTPDTFGIETQYVGLGIGKYADTIQLSYPNFTYSAEKVIDSYTEQELKQYKYIYLSGFEYHNKQKAEQLLKKVAAAGTKVMIDVTHMPIERESKRMAFMGVMAEDIVFEKHYPKLMWGKRPIVCDEFSENESLWRTKYIEKITNPIVVTSYYGQKLNVIGTNDNENIIFIGLNLIYHSLKTDDAKVQELLKNLLGEEQRQLPDRKIVPLKIEYQDKKMIITKQGDKPINTTLAYQDCFESKGGLKEKNQILYVADEKTEISYKYPLLYRGLSMSLVAFLACIAWEIKKSRFYITDSSDNPKR